MGSDERLFSAVSSECSGPNNQGPNRLSLPARIADDANYRYPALSVKFKTISGWVDRAAGLVFRLKDKDNYYITRANALEDNFHVVSGRPVQFAGANFKVTPHAWREIKVEVRGDEFKCYYDGRLRFTAKIPPLEQAIALGIP